MRLLASFLVACVAGCSVAEMASVMDAGPPDAPPADAGPDTAMPIAARTCPAEPVSPACAPVANPCDGGQRYACYGGVCPNGNVGACVVDFDLPLAQYAEVCCENVACVRSAFRDERCVQYFDAGPMTGWDCPRLNGTTLAKAPGTCFAHGALPAADAGATSSEYCCR